MEGKGDDTFGNNKPKKLFGLRLQFSVTLVIQICGSNKRQGDVSITEEQTDHSDLNSDF